MAKRYKSLLSAKQMAENLWSLHVAHKHMHNIVSNMDPDTYSNEGSQTG